MRPNRSRRGTPLVFILAVGCLGIGLLAGVSVAGAQDAGLNVAIQAAQGLYEQGRFDEAETAARAVLKRASESFGPDNPGAATAGSLLGLVLVSKGRAEEGEPLLTHALGVYEKHFGPSHQATLILLENLGRAQYSLRRFDDSEATYRRLKDACEKAGKANSPEYALALMGFADIAIERGEPGEAVTQAERALKVVEGIFGKGRPETIRAAEALAKSYVAARRHNDVVPLCEATLKAMEGRGEGEDPRTIGFRGYLGNAYIELTRWDEAEAQLKLARATALARYGPNHTQTAALVNALANFYQARGRPDEAGKLLEQAGKDVAAGGGAGAVDSAVITINRAQMLFGIGLYDEAEPLFRQGLKALEGGSADEGIKASALNGLGALLMARGNVPGAVELLERAYEIKSRRNGPLHPDTAMIAYNLGAGLIKLNRPAEALPLLQIALNTFQGHYGPDHPSTAAVRNALTAVSDGAGDADQALVYARQALADAEARLGPAHPDVGTCLTNLAVVLSTAGQYEEAERHARRALKIKSDRLGGDHPDVALILNAIANIELEIGKGEQAVATARRAVAILEARLGPEHPDTAKMTDNLANMIFARGDVAGALPLYDRARRVRRKVLGRMLPVLAEGDRLSLLRGDDRLSLDGVLSRAVVVGGDKAWAEASANWVLNAKSLALRAVAERALIARDATTPEAKAAVKALTETRLRLAALTFDRAPADSAATKAQDQEFRALVDRERVESTALGRLLNLPDRESWVEIGRVREKLPADAVLVEFSRFGRISPGAETPPDPAAPAWSYAAWVIPAAGAGDVGFIDLGPAAPIDRAVAALSARMKIDSKFYFDEGAGAFEALCTPALKEVAALVLGPLLPRIGPAKRWMISPDGALWNVPWAALPVANGVYAVERHLIHLAATGRDLVTPPSAGAPSPPVIFADPAYDLGPSASAAPPAPPPAPASGPADGVSVSVSRAIDPGGVAKRLKYSGLEAKQVGPLISWATEAPARVFLGAEATEGRFKGLASPRALLLSTHAEYREKPASSADPAVARLPDNALLRCWLVLAGGNRHADWAGATGSSGNDGLLTGLEVLGTDLRGTELVVLSACKTAQGETFEGEGISGLRQAFQLAGAKTVLGTLWSVDDACSANMTINFFKRLSLKQDPAAALRGAQLAMIREYRKSGGAHPVFWAMFALTGDPGAGWADDPVAGDPGGPPIDGGTGPDGTPRGTSPGDPWDEEGSGGPPGRYLVGKSGPGRRSPGDPLLEGALFTAVLAVSIASARWWLRGASPGS